MNVSGAGGRWPRELCGRIVLYSLRHISRGQVRYKMTDSSRPLDIRINKRISGGGLPNSS
jgi:hypothetical protein